MPKFKAGDKVRVIGAHYHGLVDGSIGTVTERTGYGSDVWEVDGHHQTKPGVVSQLVREDHLTLVPTAQPGDTVRVVIEGKLGTTKHGPRAGKQYVDIGGHQIPLTDDQEIEVVERYVDPVDAALAALPPSADEIAIVLGRLGITGDSHAASCPIAEYVRQESGESIAINQGHWSRSGATLDATRTPIHISEFISTFDNGDYPWLKKQTLVAFDYKIGGGWEAKPAW